MALSVDIVSDVECPFCLIGANRVRQALEAEGVSDAKVTFHPFLLDGDIPEEGVDLRERLRAKFGGDPTSMFGRVEAMAKETGIPLDFAKVRRYPSTVAAHTLVRHAEDKGTQTALAFALFDAYFLEGLDIGDHEVLVGLAVKHGFEAEECRALLADAAEAKATRAEAEEASRQGVRGVPLVIFGGELAVSGAQPVEAFRQVIRQLLRA